MPKKVKYDCPRCGQPLVHVRFWNEDIFGTKNNPYIGWVCMNSECHGWWCDYCDEWHPYGTSCAVAMVRNVRDENHHCGTVDPNWKHRESDLK